MSVSFPIKSAPPTTYSDIIRSQSAVPGISADMNVLAFVRSLDRCFIALFVIIDCAFDLHHLEYMMKSALYSRLVFTQ